MTGFTALTLRALLLFAFATVSPYAWSVPSPQLPEHVDINYISPPEFKNKKEEAKFLKTWKAACTSLARGLTVGKGVWGSGVFKSHACILNKKRVAGVTSSTPVGWHLEVSEGRRTGLKMELYHGVGPKRVLESALELPANDRALIMLKNREAADLLALKLMDSLPMSRVIPVESGILSMSHSEKKVRKSPPPIAPPEYHIYALSFDDETSRWLPTYVGRANLVKAPKLEPEIKDGKTPKKKKTPPKEPAAWVWDITLDGAPVQEGQVYWAQDSRGRGKNSAGIDGSLGFALEPFGYSRDFLTAMLFDTLASGYVGIRYGYPITFGDPLISQSTMVSVFAEVRGGPLKGLRWYWDMAPEVSAIVENQELKFGWSRPTLGWSFGMNINSPIVNRVDVVPKIGVMDFKSRVPLPSIDPDETGGTIVGVDFNLKNATSFGGEIGIESATDWFLLRLWGASDIAGIVDTGGDGTVSSIRGGIDTYWDFVKIGKLFESSLLVFAVGETITLSQRAETTEPAPGTDQIINGLSYNLAFLGLGISLTW